MEFNYCSRLKKRNCFRAPNKVAQRRVFHNRKPSQVWFSTVKSDFPANQGNAGMVLDKFWASMSNGVPALSQLIVMKCDDVWLSRRLYCSYLQPLHLSIYFFTERDMAQWIERGTLSMSLPAVRFQIPLGAGFSDK